MTEAIEHDDFLQLLADAQARETAALPAGYDPQAEREALQDLGFHGTLSGFLDWVEELLMCGVIRIGEPAPDPEGYSETRLYRRVELVTGGYSTDERLIGWIKHSPMISYWHSSHRGGLDVYLVPESSFGSDYEMQWIKPRGGPFEALHHVRRIVVIDERGDRVEMSSDAGVELVYETEEGHSISDPQGVLTVRPVEPFVL